MCQTNARERAANQSRLRETCLVLKVKLHYTDSTPTFYAYAILQLPPPMTIQCETILVEQFDTQKTLFPQKRPAGVAREDYWIKIQPHNFVACPV